jgi:RNA polymerase sigma-70 factor (sigma-E family)
MGTWNRVTTRTVSKRDVLPGASPRGVHVPTKDFDMYVRERLPALRRSAYLLCGNCDRGDDLLQRVLVDLYVYWSRARKAENLDAYVHTILVRRFADERRSGWARWVRLRDPDKSPDLPAPSNDNPDARMDIVAALATLPPRQRAVIVLRFLQDMSVEQTAEAMGCSCGTVKSHTSRALGALRALLVTAST